MSEYAYEYHRFEIDERGLAEALGLDYDDVLKDRVTDEEERAGLHGESRREIREALDELHRGTMRQMFGSRG